MASTETDFWERRREISPSGGTHASFDGYRLGLLAEITSSDIRAAGENLCTELDVFGCFESSSPSAFHLTVKLFNIQVDSSVSQVADSSNATRRIGEIVADLTTVFDPFSVQFPRINLFPDVVYGEVNDRGQLADLNEQLCEADTIEPLERDRDGFIPHLTLGYFVNDTGYTALIDFLEANRTLQFPSAEVDELSLVAYDASERPPRFNRLNTYSL